MECHGYNETPAWGVHLYRIYDAMPQVPGDADGDGDLADFVILKANFGIVSGAAWSNGDFNDDGAVNLEDFVILKTNFGS